MGKCEKIGYWISCITLFLGVIPAILVIIVSVVYEINLLIEIFTKPAPLILSLCMLFANLISLVTIGAIVIVIAVILSVLTNAILECIVCFLLFIIYKPVMIEFKKHSIIFSENTKNKEDDK